MKKILLLVLILLVACDKLTGSNPDTDDLEFRKGSEALLMEFEDGLPQDEVYDQSTIPLGIRLTNNGAYRIEAGLLAILFEEEWVELSNLRLNNQPITGFQSSSNIVEFDMEAKSLNNPQGDLAYLSATLKTSDIGDRSQVDTSIRAQACYRFRTIADATVCLDPDVFQEVSIPKPCEAEDVSLDSQGGPVAVTEVEVDTSPREGDPTQVVPRFVITIENVGDGEVVSPYFAQEACSDQQLGLSAFNEVQLIAKLPDESGQGVFLTCVPSLSESEKTVGKIKLKSGKDTVRCFLEEGIPADKGAFTTVLNIELSYAYTHTITKDFIIKRP